MGCGASTASALTDPGQQGASGLPPSPGFNTTEQAAPASPTRSGLLMDTTTTVDSDSGLEHVEPRASNSRDRRREAPPWQTADIPDPDSIPAVEPKPRQVPKSDEELQHEADEREFARIAASTQEGGLPYDDLDDIPETSKLLNVGSGAVKLPLPPPPVPAAAPPFPFYQQPAGAPAEGEAGDDPHSPSHVQAGASLYSAAPATPRAALPPPPMPTIPQSPATPAREGEELASPGPPVSSPEAARRHGGGAPEEQDGPGLPPRHPAARAPPARQVARQLMPEASGQAPPPGLPAPRDIHISEQDIQAYAVALGMDLPKDSHLLWIAEQALKAPLPEGWEEVLHSDGQAYFLHRSGNTSSWTHPLEAHYVKLYFGLRDQDAPSAGGQGEAAAVLPTGGQSSAMNSIRGRVLLGGLQPGPFPASDGDLGTSMATAVPVPESARPGSERSSIDRPRRSRARQAASQSRPVSSQSSRPYSSHSAQYSAPGPAPPFDPRSMNMNHMMTSSVPAMPSFQPLPPMPMPMPAVGAAWASPAAAMYSGSSVPSQAVPLPPAGQSPKRPHSRSRAKKQQGGGALSPRGLHSSVPLPQAEASALNPLAGEASVEHVLESRLTHLSSTLWMVQSQLGAVQHEFEQFKSASPSPAAQRPHGLPDSPTSPAEGGAAVLSDTDNAAGPRQYDLEPQPFPILA